MGLSLISCLSVEVSNDLVARYFDVKIEKIS